ncbi:MAG TPA: hypothetical protein VFU50_12085 [Terriglobales bacterium]|nr:hypothetical protein [Terriglobales bacterium]
MKKMLSLLFIAGTLCAANLVNAQTVLKVTVPFDFVVGKNTLQAASYNIQRPSSNDSTGIAFVADGSLVLSRASAIDSTVNGARLEFVKIGNQYFLTDVVTPTGTLHFPLSRKRVQVMVNANHTSVEGVVAEQSGR